MTNESGPVTREELESTIRELSLVIERLSPLADLARKIGEAVRQYRCDGDMSALACLLDDIALIDRAASLTGNRI